MTQDTNVIAEGDLVIQLTTPSPDSMSGDNREVQGGGQGGTAVVNDSTLSIERDNTMHHGIGNNEPVDHTAGNKTYTLDEEAQVSREVYEAMKAMYREDIPAEGAILDDDGDTPTVDVNIGKIVWNTIELGTSDGDDVTINFSADCYDVDL